MPTSERTRTPGRAPLWIVTAVCLSVFAASSIGLLVATGGRLTYALDDAYIHMALAKHVATNSAWSLHTDGFTAASSSPLWTALLAVVYSAVGVHDAVPLVLNLASALALLVLVLRILAATHVGPSPRAATAIVMTLATPLVPMIWIGMEHVLQLLLTMIVAFECARAIEQRRSVRLLCVAAALLVATRYEGLFIISGCALVLLLARRRAAAAAVVFAGAVPVVIVGVWNVSHGWFFLPASVLMKQTVVGGTSTVPTPAAMLDNVAHAGIPPGLLLLAACALLLLITSSRAHRRSAAGTMVIVFVAATAQHLLFAKFGWLYRYEAYLVGLGIVSVAAFACSVRPAYLGFGQLRTGYTIALAVAMTLIVFGERAFGSHVEAARLAGHVARQQIAIARFVARNYAQQPVAMNDVGAASYLSSARVLDLMGLGSIEAARLRRAGRFDAAHVNAWLDDRGATVAIVYDDWFTGSAGFQREWVRAGSWATEASSAVESRVAFYGRTRVDAERLRRALHEFERDLAPGVTVSYDLTPQDED